MKRIIGQFVLFVTSVGWLVPVGLALYFLNEWANNDLIPKLTHSKTIVHSFPYYSAGVSAMRIAFIWVSLVVFSWAAYLLLIKPNRTKNESAF